MGFRLLNLADERRCFIHIGTHKTGTTYLQDAITKNAHRFAEAGILVARTGRPYGSGGSDFIGNHNIAWQLSDAPRFHPTFGTLEDLATELAESHLKDAIVSSEDFAIAFDKAERLAALRDTCIAAGYRPTVIVYLRDQASYAQSLYAMWVVNEGLAIAFETLHSYIEKIAMLGWGIGRIPFHYDRLLEPFEKCFGREDVLARAYRGDLGPDYLLRDFLSLFESQPILETEPIAGDRLSNRTPSALDVMGALHRNLRKEFIPAREIAIRENISLHALEHSYMGVAPEISTRFSEQFAASNALVKETYGVVVRPFVPPTASAWEAQTAFVRACAREWGLVA